MAQLRRRIKHLLSFEERLAEQSRRLIEEAESLPSGSKARDLLLRRAEQTQSAAGINEWLRSSPPK
jgi:hypothetical protein